MMRGITSDEKSGVMPLVKTVTYGTDMRVEMGAEEPA